MHVRRRTDCNYTSLLHLNIRRSIQQSIRNAHVLFELGFPGHTLLEYAVIQRDICMIRMLIARGVCVHDLVIRMALTYIGNDDILTDLLKVYINNINNVCPVYGNSILAYALGYSCIDNVHTLLQFGAELPYYSDTIVRSSHIDRDAKMALLCDPDVIRSRALHTMPQRILTTQIKRSTQ